MRAVVRVFVAEAMNFNEPLQRIIPPISPLVITRTPEAEKANGLAIDLVRVTYIPSAETARAAYKTPTCPLVAKSYVMEFRFAYCNDKLLVTAGPKGQAEMKNLIVRVKELDKEMKTSYKSTPQYAALKQRLPQKIHGFEAFSLHDLTRMVVGYMPADKKQKDLTAFMKSYAPLASKVVIGQEGTAGCLRYEVRVPAEQVRFLLSLLKRVVEITPAKPAALPVKKK